MGAGRFARALREAGLSGAIVPDLPLEEAGPLREALAAGGLDLVPLIAPTTGVERMRAIARTARGVLYYVSVTGGTRAGAAAPAELQRRVACLRSRPRAPG